MVRAPHAITLLPLLPVLLVYLTGVVVASILLVRRQTDRGPAVFALVGFTLLFLVGVANLARGWLIWVLARRAAVGVIATSTGVGCCYSVFQVAGGLCLIVAIWQALARPDSTAVISESESTTPEEAVRNL